MVLVVHAFKMRTLCVSGKPCSSSKPHQLKELLLVHPISMISFERRHIWLEWNAILILVDSYSDWFAMNTLCGLSAVTVIEKIKVPFAVHGNPSKLLKDNGPQLKLPRVPSFLSQIAWSKIQLNKPRSSLKKDDYGPLLGLLDFRNDPRYQILNDWCPTTKQTCPSRRKRSPNSPQALNNRLRIWNWNANSKKPTTIRPVPPLNSQHVVRTQTEKGCDTATSLHCSSWRKRVPQKPQTSPGCSRTYSCSSTASWSHQSGCISFLLCRCFPISHQPPYKTPVKTLVPQQSPAITSARSQAPFNTIKSDVVGSGYLLRAPMLIRFY